MHVLILGGTVFLGRHLVDTALERGDRVTIFHRGRHPSPRAGDVEEVIGDRSIELDLLKGRRFDAVIDTCGYLPADVRRSAELIDADHYVFVSSASVYAETPVAPLTEHSATLDPPDATVTDVHGALYGPQKAGCERALFDVRPAGALAVRAGLIVGPYDPTDRLTYWALRMRRPGPVLAPAVPDQPVQFIDVRDLAAWLLQVASHGLSGVVNATGPRRQLTFAGLLELAAGRVTPEIRWIDENRLLAAGVAAWTELPLWVPTSWNVPGVMDLDVGRAEAAGLTGRPAVRTLADLVSWAGSDTDRVQADYGTRARSLVLTPERETDLLAQLV